MPDYPSYPVQVVTPEGPVFDGEAQILVVPGQAGQLGILAHHAPLISVLEPGETHLTDAGGETLRFATDHGYVQVRRNEALVLVGDAVPASEIDLGSAQSRLERARESLERARDGDGDIYRCEQEVRFAENLVRV